MTPPFRCALWLLVAGAVLLPQAARAQTPHKLVILRNPEASAVLLDATRRLAAELNVRGFEVAVSDLAFDPVGACLALTEQTERIDGVGGVASVMQTGDASAVLVSYDRSVGFCVSHAVTCSGADDDASLIAVRAVEVLRAHFLERRFSKPAPPPKAEATTVIAAAPTSPIPPSRLWSAGMGVHTLFHQPLRTAVTQVSLSGARHWQRWAATLWVSPVSTSLTDSAAQASAQTTLRAAFLGLSRSFSWGATTPFVALDAGLVWLTFDGNAAAPDVVVPSDLVVPVLRTRAGIALALGPHMQLTPLLGVELWKNTPMVQIKQTAQRTLGNPVLSFGVQVHVQWGNARL